MNRLLIIFAIVLYGASTIEAKEENLATVVKTNGDTIICEIPTFEMKVLTNSTFEIKIQGKKHKLSISDIDELRFNNQNYVVIEFTKTTRQGSSVKVDQIKKLA